MVSIDAHAFFVHEERKCVLEQSMLRSTLVKDISLTVGCVYFMFKGWNEVRVYIYRSSNIVYSRLDVIWEKRVGRGSGWS